MAEFAYASPEQLKKLSDLNKVLSDKLSFLASQEAIRKGFVDLFENYLSKGIEIGVTLSNTALVNRDFPVKSIYLKTREKWKTLQSSKQLNEWWLYTISYPPEAGSYPDNNDLNMMRDKYREMRAGIRAPFILMAQWYKWLPTAFSEIEAEATIAVQEARKEYDEYVNFLTKQDSELGAQAVTTNFVDSVTSIQNTLNNLLKNPKQLALAIGGIFIGLLFITFLFNKLSNK